MITLQSINCSGFSKQIPNIKKKLHHSRNINEIFIIAESETYGGGGGGGGGGEGWRYKGEISFSDKSFIFPPF